MNSHLCGFTTMDVGSLPAGERRSPVGQDRDRAGIGRVDVEPQALALGDVGDRRDRIDRGGGRRPDRGDDGDRRQARGPVGRDRGGERVGPHLEALVHRDPRPHDARPRPSVMHALSIELCASAEA